MSRWCDWIPVSPDEAQAFIAAKAGGEVAVLERLQPWLERLEELPLHLAMDKVWEPIYRCLSGDRSEDLYFRARTTPLSLIVHGGRQLLLKGDRTVTLVDAKKTASAARAAAKVEQAWLREQFFALPDEQFHKLDEETFAWVWEHFQTLPPFYAAAAQAGQAVVCTISH